MRVQFKIPGPPQAKARARFRVMASNKENPKTKSKKSFFVKTYTPEKTVSYENLIKSEFVRQCGEAAKFGEKDQLDMRIFAYYGIPKSTTKSMFKKMLEKIIRPTKKPDIDNVIKVVCDSLNKVAYKDDTQIVDIMARKFYSENPRVEVIIQIAK